MAALASVALTVTLLVGTIPPDEFCTVIHQGKTKGVQVEQLAEAVALP